MFKKISLFLALVVFASFTFISCDENSILGGDTEITSLSNIIANTGDVVTINGTGFGLSQEATYKVMIGSIEATSIKSWSDSKIEFTVPSTVVPSNDPTTIQVIAEKTSSKKTFYIGNANPAAPLSLKATSVDGTAILLTWDASADEPKAIFDSYELIKSTKGGAPESPIKVTKDSIPYLVKGLEAGTIYTFEIRAKYNSEAKDALSNAYASVDWSPADRFNETSNSTPIRVYGAASQFGSGLNIFDALEGAPVIYKIASSTDWQFCLFDKSGKLEFGSARASSYTFSNGQPQDAEVAATYYFANGLNEVFLGQALNTLTFSSQVFNLNDAAFKNQDKGVVFVVRTKDAVNNYNYAKIFIEKVAGSFVQGSGNDTYVQCYISYQKKGNIPYANF